MYFTGDVIAANSTRPSGQAHVVDGGFRLSGRWSPVSGCELATWMVLWLVVHEDGKPLPMPSGGPEIRFMLMPASQCEIIDTWTVGGLRGSHDVAAHDVFVSTACARGVTSSTDRVALCHLLLQQGSHASVANQGTQI